MEYDPEVLWAVGIHFISTFGFLFLLICAILALGRQKLSWMAPGIMWFLLLGIALEGEHMFQGMYSEWPTWSTHIPMDIMLQLTFFCLTGLVTMAVAIKLRAQRKK